MAISKRQSLQLKIAELAKVADQLERGLRPEGWYPETIEEVRQWERPGVFECWVSKSVDAPSGPYPQLAEALRQVLQKIEDHSLNGLRRTIRKQKGEISALTRQNVELESVVRELSDKLEVAGRLDANDRTKIIQLYRK
ncbi:hypothetical protein [Rhizobium phaseoli]|uniref:hypothetical protein n=1 Tax=Rhizobium phaseoli TaxID=396 RepID=UPI001438633D|nr:hypothetical protein [Rhizobium phaseoli]MDK4728740.1 hypothetical protein [Rhizobium phaseoli]NKE86822.1 hypothetical protein [Rhizobium phaseoli]